MKENKRFPTHPKETECQPGNHQKITNCIAETEGSTNLVRTHQAGNTGCFKPLIWIVSRQHLRAGCLDLLYIDLVLNHSNEAEI